MPNSINLVTKFQPLLDAVYKEASLTGDLENTPVQFDGSKTVKVLKLTVPALGKYTRNSGYTAGYVSADWEPFTMNQDRGTKFNIDAMDNEETLNMTFGKACSEFIRTQVVPQVDTYRFAALGSTAGIGRASGSLTAGTNVLSALRTAMTAMDEAEVTKEGRILYITPTYKGLIDDVDLTKSKAVMDRFAKVVVVPGSRLISRATVADDGSISKPSATTENLTGDGSTRVFTLTASGGIPSYLDSVKVGGTAKTEGTDWTYDAATGKITFTTAPAAPQSGTNIEVKYGQGFDMKFMIVEPQAAFAIAKHTKLRVFDPDVNQTMDSWEFQYRLYHDCFVYPQKAAGIYIHC